jgi:hypothetical protein
MTDTCVMTLDSCMRDCALAVRVVQLRPCNRADPAASHVRELLDQTPRRLRHREPIVDRAPKESGRGLPQSKTLARGCRRIGSQRGNVS